MGSTPEIPCTESIIPKGKVEVFSAYGSPKHILLGHIPNKNNLPLYRDHRIDFTDCHIIDTQVIHNIILNQGKDLVIDGLTSVTNMSLARLAVGDRGTIPSDPTVPKVPLPSMTTLYNEVYRADADAIVKNTGSGSHELRLVKTFYARDVAITAFSNQSKPVLNEVGLVMINPSLLPLPRTPSQGPYAYPSATPYPYLPVSPYNYPPQDEVLFSIRTFKSVPFEVSTDITITIRYTIYIE